MIGSMIGIAVIASTVILIWIGVARVESQGRKTEQAFRNLRNKQ